MEIELIAFVLASEGSNSLRNLLYKSQCGTN